MLNSQCCDNIRYPGMYVEDMDDLSLDDIIRMRRANGGGSITALHELGRRRRSPATMTNQHLQNGDVDKSLDTIIQERGIPKPVTSKREDQGSSSDSSWVAKPAPSKVTLSGMDPCSHSLDQLIVRERQPIPGHVAKRSNDSNGEGQNSFSRLYNSPYRAVSFLSEAGMIIEMRIGKMEHDSCDRSHLWRCEVTCGTIKGVSDSLRKIVAREMACKDFLTHLKEEYPSGKVPRYEVPEELFIDPRVFHLIIKIAAESAIDVCHQVQVKITDKNNARKSTPMCTYICTYYVGAEECVGESHLIEYAKLKAAKLAYEFLTGSPLSPTAYFTGEECSPATEYTFNESEVFQIMAPEGQPLDFPQEEFSIDSNEGKRELARRKLSQQFKQAQKEDVERRRHMPIDVCPSSAASTSQTANCVTVMDTEPEVVCEVFKPEPVISTKRPAGRGRGIVISKFARMQRKDSEDEESDDDF